MDFERFIEKINNNIEYKTIVKKVLSNEPCALQNAPEYLRNDKELVLFVARFDRLIGENISNNLKKDKEFLLEYPSLTNQFLKDILNDKINRAYLIQNSGFEDIQEKQQLFESLSTAILDEKTINFLYNDQLRIVNPYKLINTNGIWYLSATENITIKTYTFSKIKSLKISNDKFKVDKEILKEIEKSEINFLSKESKEVHLKIQNSAKEYFLRKKVLSNMKIIDNTDEYFAISTNVSFDDEILNIVKQWIPYIEIVKPIELQEKLECILKEYLKNNKVEAVIISKDEYESMKEALRLVDSNKILQSIKSGLDNIKNGKTKPIDKIWDEF